jgi:hypothetical protein
MISVKSVSPKSFTETLPSSKTISLTPESTNTPVKLSHVPSPFKIWLTKNSACDSPISLLIIS